MSLKTPTVDRGVFGIHSPYVPALNCLCGHSPEYTSNWMGYRLKCVNRDCPYKLKTSWRDTSWYIGRRWNELVEGKK